MYMLVFIVFFGTILSEASFFDTCKILVSKNRYDTTYLFFKSLLGTSAFKLFINFI